MSLILDGRSLSSGRLGVNTGLATVQCSLSALVMENKTLSTPGSVDPIPGKGNAEDHVSNSIWCARKAGTVVDNAEYIIAGELLTAAEALDMVPEEARRFPIGKGSAAALSALRKTILPVLDGDIWYAAPMVAARELVRASSILRAGSIPTPRLTLVALADFRHLEASLRPTHQ